MTCKELVIKLADYPDNMNVRIKTELANITCVINNVYPVAFGAGDDSFILIDSN